MDDWIVSIVKNGKVTELYFSDGLRDITAIRAMHRDCDVEVMRLVSEKTATPEEQGTKVTKRFTTRRVVCFETGVVFDSAFECSEVMGVSRCNIYKAIQRGIAAGGFHFNYID